MQYFPLVEKLFQQFSTTVVKLFELKEMNNYFFQPLMFLKLGSFYLPGF